MEFRDPYFRDFAKSEYRLNKWVYFAGHELASFLTWDKPCCYVIYGDGKLLYIGQTNSFRHRCAQHKFSNESDHYMTPWGPYNWIYAKAFFPSRYGYEAMMEKRFIKRLRPPFNKRIMSGRHYGRVERQLKERVSIRG